MTIVEFITARVDEDHARATAVIESLRRDGASTGLVYDGDLATWHRDDNYQSEGTGVYTSLLSITEPDIGGGAFEGVHMVIYSGDGKPSYEVAGHIIAEDPAATLRRCVGVGLAVTAILAEISNLDGEFGDGCSTKEIRAAECKYPDSHPDRSPGLRALASFWSNHPDYQPEWAPNPS